MNVNTEVQEIQQPYEMRDTVEVPCFSTWRFILLVVCSFIICAIFYNPSGDVTETSSIETHVIVIFVLFILLVIGSWIICTYVWTSMKQTWKITPVHLIVRREVEQYTFALKEMSVGMCLKFQEGKPSIKFGTYYVDIDASWGTECEALKKLADDTDALVKIVKNANDKMNSGTEKTKQIQPVCGSLLIALGLLSALNLKKATAFYNQLSRLSTN